jgi:bleomycin hydrolase
MGQCRHTLAGAFVMTTSPTLDPIAAARATGALGTDRIAAMQAAFEAEPRYRIAQNAVAQVPADEIALSRRVVTSVDHTFSHVLDDWSVTNQKQSGRCWIFAGLNLFRAGAMRAMNVREFEFSQSYTHFWDKLERANYFLEAIIATAERPLDDRTVAFLLDRPLDDGGQWNMFVNLVRKHGVVPKSVMPETESSGNTRRMNGIVVAKLREAAAAIRGMEAHGAPIDEQRAYKDTVLGVVYRILSIHLGTPPASFDWQWTDKDRAFHRDGVLTPREFADKYITVPVDEYVCLVNDPRPTSPYGSTFTVEYLGNVVEGGLVTYLNVPIETMKQIAMQTLLDGEPVWFGCDSGKMLHRGLGIWDTEIFDYEALYGAEFRMTKAERLAYHQTLMTHAMLFTGVDIADGQPRRWRVENSWGAENTGRNGFFVITDRWFDEHMFEIAARTRYLPADLRAALDQPPIVLPAWDPMGALARM